VLFVSAEQEPRRLVFQVLVRECGPGKNEEKIKSGHTLRGQGRKNAKQIKQKGTEKLEKKVRALPLKTGQGKKPGIGEKKVATEGGV